MYKLSEVCRKIGVTRRTLQGYNELGLVKPSAKTEAGYWLYDEESIGKLAIIQVFVEIGYKRAQIKKILSRPDLNLKREFEVAIEALQNKKTKIDEMIALLRGYEIILSLPDSVVRPLMEVDLRKIYQNISFSGAIRKTMGYISKTGQVNESEFHWAVLLTAKLLEIGYLNGEDPSSKSVQDQIDSILDILVDLFSEQDENFLLEGKNQIPKDFLCLVVAKYISAVGDKIFGDKDFQEWMTLCFGDGAAEFVIKANETYCELHQKDIEKKYDVDLENIEWEDMDG